MQLKQQIEVMYKDYNLVKFNQRRINKAYKGVPLKYKGGMKCFDDGFNFEFVGVHVSEDCVEIKFYIMEQNEPEDCVDYISFDEFNKYFEVN